MSKKKENKWSQFATRILLNTASHPLEYAKVLIQIGYEPIQPKHSTTFFGKPALVLPNIFQYVKHIKSIDGLSGCYRGLGPKVTGNVLSALVSQKIIDYMKEKENDEPVEETEEDRKKKFIKSVKCEILTHAAAIVVSQPFHVITVRMMAQFIGRETKYVGFLGSIREIYHQNGMFGFFSGLVPRIIGDMLSLMLASSLTYAINYYIVEEKELQVYTGATMSFLATAITYPFQVVSNCMTVSNSGLMAGSSLFMKNYSTWVDCWMDLSERNQLKRGSSLLLRYYTGPPLVGSPAFPYNKNPLLD